METIKNILSQYGYINKEQLAELADHFPHTTVVVKWGGMPRDRFPAWQAIERIADVEKKDIDYCREVFLTAGVCNALREVFKIAY